jgi:hypothetical protein
MHERKLTDQSAESPGPSRRIAREMEQKEAIDKYDPHAVYNRNIAI